MISTIYKITIKFTYIYLSFEIEKNRKKTYYKNVEYFKIPLKKLTTTIKVKPIWTIDLSKNKVKKL